MTPLTSPLAIASPNNGVCCGHFYVNIQGHSTYTFPPTKGILIVKKRLSVYIGREIREEEIHWELVRLAMMSIADTALIPIQDIFVLGQ